MATNLVQYVIDIVTGTAKKNLDGLEDRVEALNKDLERTQKESKEATTSLARMKKAGAVLSKVGMAVTAVAIAVAGVSVASFKAVKKVTDLTNELNDLSVRSGLTSKTIQGLRQSLLASGQPAEGLNEILGAMSNQFAQLATEGSAVEKKFNSFGIAVKDTSGKLRSNNDILLDGIKKLQGISDASARSRTAVLLFGEAGAKLNQALAAGNFEDFLAFTEEFGIKTGPEASQAAADMQLAMSSLNTVFNSSLQRLVNLVDGQKKLTNGMITLGSQIVFVVKLTEGLEKAYQKAHFAIKAFIDFLGRVAIGIIIGPLLNAFYLGAKFAGIFEDQINSLIKTINNLSGGMLGLKASNNSIVKAFSEAIEESDRYAERLKNMSGNVIDFTTSQEQMKKETKETTKEIKEQSIQLKSLNDVIRDIGNVAFDPKAFIETTKVIFNSLQDGFIKFTKFADNSFVGIGDQLIIAAEKGSTGFFNIMNNLVIKIQSLFDGISIKIFEGFAKVEGSKIIANLAKFITTSPLFSSILGVLNVAEAIGSKGGTQKEIKKNIEEDIRARARAISLGLQVLPSILFDVFPPLFRQLADQIGLALSNLFKNLVQRMIDAIREGPGERWRQNNAKLNEQGFKVSVMEFLRRMSLGNIGSKRSGGRYIPSARGGIKFTGADEGLAMLHRGEFVVPETGQMPQAVQRTMGMGNGGITININASVVESNAVDELVRQIERRFQTFGSSTSPLFGGS
jgi:hypothetical protein